MIDDAWLRERVMETMGQVIDPELGLDVVSLGLVYGVEVHDGNVVVDLTMTTPSCPLGEHIVNDADQRLRSVPDVKSVEVRLVWDPPWRPERMSEMARRALGWGA